MALGWRGCLLRSRRQLLTSSASLASCHDTATLDLVLLEPTEPEPEPEPMPGDPGYVAMGLAWGRPVSYDGTGSHDSAHIVLCECAGVIQDEGERQRYLDERFEAMFGVKPPPKEA